MLGGMDYYPADLNTREILEYGNEKLREQLCENTSYNLLFRLAYWANEALGSDLHIADDGKDWIRLSLGGNEFEIRDYGIYSGPHDDNEHCMFSFKWADSVSSPCVMNTLPINLVSILGSRYVK